MLLLVHLTHGSVNIIPGDATITKNIFNCPCCLKSASSPVLIGDAIITTKSKTNQITEYSHIMYNVYGDATITNTEKLSNLKIKRNLRVKVYEHERTIQIVAMLSSPFVILRI